ncbi:MULTISPECIES: hypothetical protein [unclassified Serratia (in: enterobacteria)]|uniref:hypothetical protein n=1 Tax=unclassified Serratia (in: enterobacteria) TaxID=2647522 RepID=UPI002ED407C8|nr:hypothetical protein [Serratia sp. C2(1)]
MFKCISNQQQRSRPTGGSLLYALSVEIHKGDQFHLDNKHKSHLYIIDNKYNFRFLLNMDGSVNPDKTKAAAAEGRKLPK